MSAVSPVAPPPTASKWTLLLCAAMATLSSIIYGIIFVLTPSYAKLFMGFGADLPLLTRLYLASGPWLIVLGIVGFTPVVLFALNRRAEQRERNVYIGLSVGSLLLALFIFAGWVVASYLPIWTMGSTI